MCHRSNLLVLHCIVPQLSVGNQHLAPAFHVINDLYHSNQYMEIKCVKLRFFLLGGCVCTPLDLTTLEIDVFI